MKKNILFILVALMTMVSCSDDFLNVTPKDRYSDATVWKDNALAEAFVNNIYEGQYYGLHTVLFSAIDDQAMEVWSWESQPVVNNAISSSYVGILAPDFWIIAFQNVSWNKLYKNIRNCNLFFQRVQENGLEGSDIEQLKGEVHYLRAYFYSWLMSFHGGVPIITKAYEAEDDMLVERNTLEETVNFIVADLDSAAMVLPVSTDKAKASKGAALALKSRVLLYAASDLFNSKASWSNGYAHPELVSYTDDNRQQRWQKAKEAAKAVIDLGTYQLVGEGGFSTSEEAIENYKELFINHGTTEDIMLTYYDNVNHSTSDFQCPSFGKFNSPNGYHGWGGNVPTQQMVDSYEMADGSKFSWNNPEEAQHPYLNRDPRFYATVLYDGAYWKQRPDDVIGSDPDGIIQTGYYEQADGSYNPGLDTRNSPIDDWNGTYTGYYMCKGVDPNMDQQYEYQKYPYRQIRYAEVLLNYAECCIELGEEAEARKYLNLIRNRANMPSLDASVTGTALRERYRNERNIELAYEQNRFFDIRRWMIAPEVIKNAQGIDIRYPKGSTTPTYSIKDVQTRSWDNKNYLIPILLDEMQKNELLIQNPGY